MYFMSPIMYLILPNQIAIIPKHLKYVYIAYPFFLLVIS